MHSKDLISLRFSLNALKRVQQANEKTKLIEKKNVSKLLLSEYSMTHEPCICGANDGWIIAEYDRYELPLQSVICPNCGTIRIDPYLDKKSCEHFYNHVYQNLYRRSINKKEYFLRQKLYGNKYHEIAKSVLTPDDWVLEIGCGAGGALSVFHQKGYRVLGVELDQELIDFGINMGVPNLFFGSLDELPVQHLSVRAKLIYLNHVFEHVINPKETLSKLKGYLHEDGLVLMAVPNILEISIDDNYSGDLLGMLHISHKYNYTFQGLKELANQIGLNAMQIYPDPKLITHTSNMGELWVQFTLLNDDVTIKNTNYNIGYKTLNKIKAYENNYQKRLKAKKILRSVKKYPRQLIKIVDKFFKRNYS